MIHPSSELRFISAEIGYGVFATEFIPRGTFLWVLDPFDRILSAAERETLPALLRQQVDRYAYQAADGDFVFCWDFGRYMNHSCAPASRGIGDAFEIAVRDIQPGEELTCEYGTLNLVQPMACRCGALSCRGEIRRDDAERFFERWDAEARAAFELAGTVPQPLLPYAKAGPRDLPLLAALRSGTPVEVPSARAYHVPAAEGQSP
ncbi:SET domain-containing protein [Aquimonas voraii]|uniref:SET domain-containing protein n=1 Tax=Aquimonas voraii TaxID=265719 RepID=A0A1G6XSM6_9GAMM|nr:SET domain-containing protein [Aquimonas voraii]SDD81168.1 hypothetical protein SAMN04488509_107142 [Aquimonas voraii]